jgi:allophanate hydrolase
VTWSGSLDLRTLRAAYAAGTLSPVEVVHAIHNRIAAAGETHAWIHLPPRDQAERAARAAMARPQGPLWGIPFSVKDCNDVPGMPTTNAFPPTAYVPQTTGQAIARLLDAGAICLGKTNMDQFGIGLVGMRTPYGACANPFDARFISGGSSSGSAVSVALGQASFSIGNDAAGSGRVPAAFCNIVGLKPTPGLVSNSCVTGGGCVKTIETVSVFALTAEDALEVLRLIAGFDPSHPFSRPEADDADLLPRAAPARFAFGIPKGEGLRFFGDDAAARMFTEAVRRLEAMGGTVEEVDFAPFEEVQRILYDGPWIAERALVLDEVLARHGPALHPVTRQILEGGSTYSAKDTFRAIHRIAELKAVTRPLWARLDALVVPSTPTIYRMEEIEADPIALNARLGIYTNFVNLMGLSGIAVPNGFRPDGLPQGITLLGPPFAEARLAALGGAYHRGLGVPLGATGHVHPPVNAPRA